MMSFLIGGALTEDAQLSFGASQTAIILGIIALIVALSGLYWTRRQTAHQYLKLEMVLWLSAALVLGVALTQPTLTSDSGRLDKGRFVVLIDKSASMGAIEDGQARSDRIPEILKQIRTDLSTDIEVFGFDSQLHVGMPASYTGMDSDLGGALTQLNDRYLGQQLAGIAVITDGIDRGALGQQLEMGAEVQLPQLSGPITFYGVGSVESLFDVSVVNVSAGNFAFQRMDFELDVQLKGPPNYETNVILSSNGRELESQPVRFNETGEGRVQFIQRPLEVGRLAWEVNVPVDPRDMAPANNVYPVVVKVVRETTRVLQVCGAPSYDQKFLRLFLKQDPSVELVSFFILRTYDDFGAGWDSDELSLIEFPYRTLFSRDLKTFDLVMLQNFDYKSFFQRDSMELLSNIKEYVLDGGALIMLGGDRSFDLGEYNNTPIADILPVQLGVAGELSSALPFQPQLTVSGAQHPIVQLSSSPERSRDVWSRLSEMDGFNKNNGLAEGGAALLQHPTARTDNGQPVPILAVKEAGKGRIMSLGVDSSWRWSFSEAVEGEGNLAYLRFWKNALRWLQADPEDLQVVVTPERENALLNQELGIEVWVRDTSYSAVAGASFDGFVETPSGERIPISGTTGDAGESQVVFTPTEQGTHRIQVYYGEQTAKTVFAATAREPELLELQSKATWLKQLAQRAPKGGLFVEEGRYQSPLIDTTAQREIPERTIIQLGAAPLWPLLFGVFAGAGWILRRRDGGR
ncbi:MAG: glutamine amidotransferase [Myxococcota bacterium]|nr:glutamine amidotransferase [Myxococcota bacterium]